MTLLSLKKRQITRQSTLQLTVSKAVQQGVFLLGSICAVTSTGGAFAAEAAGKQEVHQETEVAASQRWLELRQQIWSKSTLETTRSGSTGRPGASTTLEQVFGDGPVVTKLEERHARGPVQRTAGRRQVGQVVHSFSTENEALAEAPESAVRLMSQEDVLSELSGSIAAVPPTPIAMDERPEGTTAGELFPAEGTLFQSITKIQPYQRYSPTASADGKSAALYFCPLPAGTPEEQQQRCPEVLVLPKRGSLDRHFAVTSYHWVASDLHSKPLYFEDIALERYGQQYPVGVQPFVSIGRFGFQVLALPYKMAIDPVDRDIYALGHYRPGDCPPEIEYQIPLNAKAAITAAGVYTGIVFLVP
ncbi:hypothetical protein [Planctomicrobium sp. SH527]|uniref:hypothetical protein n=1 Tax=Planctomicrobium sp. SH527 TaxID=3448123 RepID=UPI003F5C3E8D